MKIVCVAMAVLMVEVMCVGCKKNTDRIPDPGGNFTYDRVQVVLTEEASNLDNEWTPVDFPEFSFSRIENLGKIKSQSILIFYLTEPSRNNVLRAIYQLRKRAEIHTAEPSWIATGA